VFRTHFSGPGACIFTGGKVQYKFTLHLNIFVLVIEGVTECTVGISGKNS
jgi:hypothetical protein